MSIGWQLLDIGLVAVIFGAVLYWIFVSPQRAKKRRRELLGSPGGSYSRAWDPDIMSRKR